MALGSAEAILLDVRDLGEADRIAVFLTRERGRKSGVARGARRKHSRFAGQLQPLAKVRISWFEKPERELLRISSVDLLRPAAKLQADLEGILVGSYLAEHLLVFAQEDEASDLLFRLADSSLEALLAGVDRNLAARYFEAWVLRLAGIFPPPLECPLCGRSLTEGAVLPRGGEGLICGACAGGADGTLPPGSLWVGPEGVDFLLRIGRERLADIDRRPPERAVLRRAEQVAARVRREFLQGELKSYRIMGDVLGSVGD
jgi:DNA repair protein RecO (recombination protein O)